MRNKRRGSGDVSNTQLGLDAHITRRDFLGGALIGSGAALLGMPAPATASDPPLAAAWNGYAGVGDYARSNGNTWAVQDSAHLIRDGKVDALLGDAVETGEVYDLIVAGGGFSGLGAVRTYLREAKSRGSCLVLESHALSGGEAKRNEFLVDGYRILGPQGSNLVAPPSVAGDWYDELWKELGIPREPAFQKLTGHRGELRINRENYFVMFGNSDQIPSCGYFFDGKRYGGKSFWDIDSQRSGYRHTAFPERVKADLRALVAGTGKNLVGAGWQQWLDGMSFERYLVDVLGMSAETARLFDAPMTVEGGLGSDCVSALLAQKVGMPGFEVGYPTDSMYRSHARRVEDLPYYSFPGGNDAVYRLLLKGVLPQAIAGGGSFAEIHNGAYQFDQFDRPGSPVRLRLNSTVLRIEHEGSAENSTAVRVTYRRDGKLYRCRTKGVVSALGGWVNKHIVQDLPPAHQQAFAELVHGSALVINVALRNWRFLAKLGISAAQYFVRDGFGQCCNIRTPMLFEGHHPPLDPAKPIVLTFYVGFPSPGLPAREQAAKARWSLLAKSYGDWEREIRALMSELFAGAGFQAKRDIAGIVLNRWGHSYVVPQPGFYYGSGGRPPPKDVIANRFGRIAFGHSELNGVQEWFSGVENGERAARQVLQAV